MTQSHTEILQDLERKIFHPLYLLEGEEAYFIDRVSDYMEQHVLPEAERSFNQAILYGKETNANDIRIRAMNCPMFSNYQLIIVKEAQELKKWDELLPYFEKPVKSTLLVFCHKQGAFDKRTKAAKAINENGVVMTSKKMYENQLPQFIEQLMNEKGLTARHEAIRLIVEFVGNDLSRIVHELDKLILNLKGRKTITADDVELNIGISKEYNNFELSKALAAKDVAKANRILTYFAANPRANPMAVTLATLQSYFAKIFLIQKTQAGSDRELAAAAGINPYVLTEYKLAARNYTPSKVESVFSLLHEYDLRSKGVNDGGNKESALLRELVFKILH